MGPFSSGNRICFRRSALPIHFRKIFLVPVTRTGVYPEASAEVRTQRGRRKYHWSGISRSEMERTLGGSAFAYQFLSWDAHGTMGPIRDVSFKLSDGMAHFRFGRLETESSVKFCAWMNGGVLYYIYNDFARMWGLPAVVPPNAAT